MVESAVFAGHLHLEAALRPDGQTILSHQSFRAPLHISKPYWDGQVLQVRVVNPTAGILSGDRIDLSIQAHGGSALLVTTPAATRAYMMSHGRAVCAQRFEAGPKSWLEYAPEPLFPHRDSSYSQVTKLQVEADGELYFCDSLAPGRTGSGECWAWRSLNIAIDLVRDKKLILRENFLGSGEALRKLASLHAMPEAWFATVVIVSEKLEPAQGVWEKVRFLHGASRWVGATQIQRGAWVVRVVATGSQVLRDTLAELRTTFSEILPRLKSDLRRL